MCRQRMLCPSLDCRLLRQCCSRGLLPLLLGPSSETSQFHRLATRPSATPAELRRISQTNSNSGFQSQPWAKMANAFSVLSSDRIETSCPSAPLGNRSDRFVFSRSPQRSPTFSIRWAMLRMVKLRGATSRKTANGEW